MRRHNRRLFRLARSLLRSDAEAEDVLQEAYLRAYARLGELAEPRALAAWLARIIANEALGRRRAAARVVSLEDFRAARAGTDDADDMDLDRGPACDRPDPERLAASGELRRLLEAAVDALPEEFRTVFVLREVEGLSTAETAACLAIRPETVKTRLLPRPPAAAGCAGRAAACRLALAVRLPGRALRPRRGRGAGAARPAGDGRCPAPAAPSIPALEPARARGSAGSPGSWPCSTRGDKR